MEKNTYEYEYIEPSTSSNAMNSLFVLQDDGTIIVNKEVQFVTQEKEDTVPNTIFEIPQQYYVDVENSTQLMVVPEQFTATTTDESNITSYLIQTQTTPVTEQMDTESIAEVKAESIDTNTTNPINSNFTEITLNNEQYQMLEQKGWVLLECFDKIFVLNTVGLHDITDNEKLISKLKAEIEEFNENKQSEPSTSKLTLNNVVTLQQNEEKGQLLMVEESVIEETTDEKYVSKELDADIQAEKDIEPYAIVKDSLECPPEEMQASSPDNISDNQNCDVLKIKTKHIFKDIPSKIYLGRTIKGKKLYAKITNTKRHNIIQYTNNDNKRVCDFYGEKIENYKRLTESQFINIIQDSLREGPTLSKVDMKDNEAVMNQLFCIPEIYNTIIGSKVIITKSLLAIDADGKAWNQKKPTITTGEVKLNDSGMPEFIVVPNLLLSLTELKAPEPVRDVDNDTVEIFHVHITELKEDSEGINQTIQVTRRRLSLKILRYTKKFHPDPVFACGACAAVFKTEDMLKEHQENKCFAEDTLTIDMDEIEKKDSPHYTTIVKGNEKWYTCTQCEAKFNRLFNCKTHIKTHNLPQNSTGDNTETNMETRKIYKCAMCPSTYFHPSSLFKKLLKYLLITVVYAF